MSARPPRVASCLYRGHVRHRRASPVEHQFRYAIFMAYLDLGELPELFDGVPLWSARRPAPAWFRRADYLGDPALPLDDEVRRLVARETGTRPRGPIRLLTHLRYLGHCFNPVSFYYCFDDHGEGVQAVVAEVTNTPWGERHAYVMPVRQTGDRGSTALMHEQLPKLLHVSPFMGMDHVYDWRLTVPGERLSVHIESSRDGERVFDATLALRREEIGAWSCNRALARQPLLTVAVLARIYGQAARLKLRGIPHFANPSKGGLPA